LADLAAEVGLDRQAAADVLAGDDYADAVDADLALALGFGASGVPFFVFDRKYGISGAQETAVFTEVLERAWAEAAPNPLVLSGDQGESCADDSCAVGG
jgi:predicted DsbA family dithiol-disulfide isomerase